MIRVGTDIVNIPEFTESLQGGGDNMRNKLFTSTEIKYAKRIEGLAGMFAAKEAFVKASGLSKISLKSIEVRHTKAGRPYFSKPVNELSKLTSVDLSIAHDGDYAIATCILNY